MTLSQGVCPACGSTEIFTKTGGVKGHAHGVYIQKGWVTSVQLDAFVCIGCGHTELGVPATRLDEVREVIRTQGWTPVERR